MSIVHEIAEKAKKASYFLSGIKTGVKNQVLKNISIALIENSHEIINANKKDCAAAKGNISESLLDRLTLNTERIKSISGSILEVVSLNDPVGEVIFGYDLPNGLTLKNIRVPFGVIGMIFEARPNVTVDSAVLCLKAGSAVILRGSSSALNTNLKIVEIMRKCLKDSDFPEDLIQLIPTASREDALELMSLRQYIDVLIPRGGKGLIESVVRNSKIPVIETGIGNCHIYIDSKFSLSEKQVIDIVVNAKTQRPSVCNAAEKLLIHRAALESTGKAVIDALRKENVKIKGCPSVMKLYSDIEEATEEDWYEEYLDLKMAVKVVENTKEAVEHINKYGSMHSDSIITSDYENAMYFTSNVDSSTVYVNASTRFTDGGQFGMGAEIGISTQKLHFRGPMGLRQITTNKFIVYGSGQIRE
ncbi:MAG: glutamate-5-semialdehyde dehydrogenase [Actinomycetota bacterium]|jgi:glutamate-5-semialdehyde dehydrogenase|nr:glutamate-5-semialdehyde dehydrogenase [Actinomycetota bacterium]